MNQTYSPEEISQIYSWADKWFQLTILIIDVTGADEPPLSPPSPSDRDELNYQRLRFWLICHEDEFLKSWQNFVQSQDWGKNRDDNLNPFSICYKAENLYQLAKELDLQSGTTIWEPSENRCNYARNVMISLGKILLKFIDWMDE